LPRTGPYSFRQIYPLGAQSRCGCEHLTIWGALSRRADLCWQSPSSTL